MRADEIFSYFLKYYWYQFNNSVRSKHSKPRNQCDVFKTIVTLYACACTHNKLFANCNLFQFCVYSLNVPSHVGLSVSYVMQVIITYTIITIKPLIMKCLTVVWGQSHQRSIIFQSYSLLSRENPYFFYPGTALVFFLSFTLSISYPTRHSPIPSSIISDTAIIVTMVPSRYFPILGYLSNRI